MCVCVLSHFSHVQLFATPWTVACLQGSSVHAILQARTLEWVAVPFSRGSSQPKDQICISYIPCIWKVVSLPLHHLGNPYQPYTLSFYSLKLEDWCWNLPLPVRGPGAWMCVCVSACTRMVNGVLLYTQTVSFLRGGEMFRKDLTSGKNWYLDRLSSCWVGGPITKGCCWMSEWVSELKDGGSE